MIFFFYLKRRVARYVLEKQVVVNEVRSNRCHVRLVDTYYDSNK